jgi:GNAT superfamily N-acetyltransferase
VVAIDVPPYADPSLRELLSQRGYHISEFNTVLVRGVSPAPEVTAAVEVRRAAADEETLYAETIMRGFMTRDEVTEEELRLGRLLFSMPGGAAFFAIVGGEVAGGCGMSVRNSVAVLFGDATLARFRKAGAQTAMIAHRLREAALAGCDIATASTQPGTTSQRNYQRHGFEVAYSKLTMVRG